MALAQFRAKQQKLKWVWWIVIVALGASMLLLFVNPAGGGRGGLALNEVARVGPHKITRQEYVQTYDGLVKYLSQIYQQQDPAILKQLGLEQQALNQLISQYAILIEADRLGLRTSSKEVADAVLTTFSQDGQFVGKERYQEILRYSRLTPAQYEDSVRRSLLHSLFLQTITAGIEVSDAEMRRDFSDRNQESKVRYIAVNSADEQPKEIDEEDLKAYYEENIALYQGTERRQATVIMVEVTPAEAEVSDAEIEAALAAADVPETIQVRHILIKKGNDAAAARAQAEKLLAEIQAGADFQEMARQHSQDAATKDRGGDLGLIRSGQHAGDFDQIAFALKAGEVASKVADTPEGFHIIQKVRDQATQARAVAELRARQEKANRLAEEKVNKALEEIKSGKTIDAAVEEYGLRKSDTGPIEIGTSLHVNGVSVPLAVANQIFERAEGEFTDIAPVGSRQFFAKVDKIFPERTLTLDEVRQKVVEAYKKDKGLEAAEAKAQQFSDEARAEGADFVALAKARGWSVTTTEFFKKGATIDETLRFSLPLHDQIGEMEVGDVGRPVRVQDSSARDNYVVIQLVEKTPFDEDAFQQEKDSIHDRMLDQKRSRFFASYVQRVVDRLRREQEIVVNQQLLNELTS